MRNRLLLLLTALLLCPPSFSQEEEGGKPRPQRWAPPSHSFYCDLPVGWSAFEEQDGFGGVVHLLGPEDPAGVYRAGIDVRWNEKGEPGFVPYKQELDEMRRGDSATSRSATPPRVLRVAGAMTRVFEVVETKRLPADRWPSLPVELHRYVAVYPSGESYFTISLASTRDSYLEYKETFLDFLKSFKPLGYK